MRGGGCCDSSHALISNQGYVNGLWYDPNDLGQSFQLHPVHLAANAGDKCAAQAQFDAVTGTVTLPARTAVVFVTN